MPKVKSSKKLHEVIKESIERRTLVVAIASFVVAVAATGAAFWSSWEAHKTRVNEERPILKTIYIPDNLAPAQFVRIQITNIGKSAAKDIRVRCASTIDDPNLKLQWDNRSE